jgi:hypothetical protein
VIGAFTATIASFFFQGDQESDRARVERRLGQIERRLDELSARGASARLPPAGDTEVRAAPD